VWNDEPIEISEAVFQIVIHGVHVEAKVEENGLRLSRFEKVSSNRDEKIGERVLDLDNLIGHRREDLEHTKKELEELKDRLYEEEDEDESDALHVQFKIKRAIRKKHEQEIERLEAKTSVGVSYQVVTKGVFTVLPAGLNVRVDFLQKVVSWCPAESPSNPFEEVEEKYEEVPQSSTSAKHTTATGAGLESCTPNQEAKFVIVARDGQGQRRDVGGDTFVVTSRHVELKSSVVDKKNGTYEVTYAALAYAAPDTEDGKFAVTVSLWGRSVHDSPFGVVLRLIPRVACGAHHTMMVTKDGTLLPVRVILLHGH
jgi:hypothetical protein